MDSRNGILVVLCMLVGFASSDVAKDRAECADQLVGLATCLAYVGGEAKAPTLDCCTGLKQVLDKSKKCLCVLVKDRNDPSLGIKINSTLALGLPTACHAPANISNCPYTKIHGNSINEILVQIQDKPLLGLAPNSPDAKVFEAFTNSTQSNSTPVSNAKGNSSSNGSSAAIKSDGGKGKKWLVVEMFCGVLVWCFTSHIIFNA